MVVADGLDQTTHPSWYLNLRATPRVLVQRGATGEMVAATVTGEERAQIWSRLVSTFPRYADHQRKARRELPVVLLRAAPVGLRESPAKAGG